MEEIFLLQNIVRKRMTLWREQAHIGIGIISDERPKVEFPLEIRQIQMQFIRHRPRISLPIFNGTNHITLFMLLRYLLRLASRPMSTKASQTPLEDVMRSKVYILKLITLPRAY